MILTSTFIAALKFANHASSKKDIRYYLEGVLFQFRGKNLHLVGTNGMALAAITLELLDAPAYDADVIVPNADIKEIVKALSQDKQGGVIFKVELNEDRKKPPVLTIEAFKQSITPKAIEAHYPDWRRVMPPEGVVSGPMPALDATLMANACEAMRLIALKTSPMAQPIYIEPGATIEKPVAIRPAVVFLPGVTQCVVTIGPIRA
jgi:DNA polymerase III beta subunit, central domain